MYPSQNYLGSGPRSRAYGKVGSATGRPRKIERANGFPE